VAAEEMAGRGADKGKNQSNNQADSIDERFHNTLLVFCWSKSPIPSRRKPERKSRFYGCRAPPHNALIKQHFTQIASINFRHVCRGCSESHLGKA
jgi:hypothetical protein